MRVEELMGAAVENNASDLHLNPGRPPILRMHGGLAPIGTELDASTPLAIIHAASDADAERAEKNLLAAVSLADAAPADRPVICDILTG